MQTAMIANTADICSVQYTFASRCPQKLRLPIPFRSAVGRSAHFCRCSDAKDEHTIENVNRRSVLLGASALAVLSQQWPALASEGILLHLLVMLHLPLYRIKTSYDPRDHSCGPHLVGSAQDRRIVIEIISESCTLTIQDSIHSGA